MAQQLHADILAHIFELLCNPHGLPATAVRPRSAFRDVVACSLVCYAWSRVAQRIIFRSINAAKDLDLYIFDDPWRAKAAFDAVLQSSQARGAPLASAVRAIALMLIRNDGISVDLACILRELAALTYVSITYFSMGRDITHPPLQIPHIRRVDIQSTGGFDALHHLLSSLPELEYLCIETVWRLCNDGLVPTLQPKPVPQLRTLALFSPLREKVTFAHFFRCEEVLEALVGPISTLALDGTMLRVLAPYVSRYAASLRTLVVKDGYFYADETDEDDIYVSSKITPTLLRRVLDKLPLVESVVFHNVEFPEDLVPALPSSVRVLGLQSNAPWRCEPIPVGGTGIKSIDFYFPGGDQPMKEMRKYMFADHINFPAYRRFCASEAARLAKSGIASRILDIDVYDSF